MSAAPPGAERAPLPPRLRSFADRVSLAAFGLTALFALAVGVASWAVTHEVLEGRIADALRLEASRDAAALEQPLLELFHDVDALARSSFVTNALVDSMGREHYVAPFLRDYGKDSSLPVRLTLCDHLGRPVASTGQGDGPSFAAAPWLATTMAQSEAVALVPPGEPARLYVARPVVFEHTGQAEGLLVAEVDLPELFRAVVPAADGGSTRRLLDRAGRVLVSDGGALADPFSTRRAVAAGHGDTLGLQLEVQVPHERIRGPLRRMALAYGAAGLLLAAAALFAARELARGLTRPVRALNEAARDAAARASFDVVVPVRGSDEVAELGTTINEMLSRLRAASEERYAREAGRRVRAEGELDLAHAALEQASEAIEILRPDGVVLYANGAAAHLAGVTPAEMVGKPIWALMPSHVCETRWRQVWEDVRRDGRREGRFELRLAGRIAPHDARLRYVSFGGAEYCLATIWDASDHVRAEQASRLASLGTLAAGVAHEINNPLAYVATNVAWAREALGAAGLPLAVGAQPADELREALDEAKQGAERVRDVVRSLRLFARPPTPRRVPNDVEQELRSAVHLASNEIRHRARLVLETAAVPPVLAGEHELGQVFTNLLVNAAQAIPPGHASEHVIRVRVREAPPGTVVVEVSDTGEGIPPEALDRIFEPFYTTKPVGSGTGLGLAVCRGIATRAGGRIDVESEAGKGSCFRVTLPAGRPVAVAEPPSREVPARRLRVLMVDDEEAIGRAVTRALSGQHELVEATSAREALERLRAGERFDVLLCDLMMPETSGVELHRTVTALDPELAARTVLITGGPFTPDAREFLESSALPVLEKPFTAEALLSTLARVTRRPAPSEVSAPPAG